MPQALRTGGRKDATAKAGEGSESVKRKERGRKGIRKDVSQLLRHLSASVGRRISVSENYICSLLSKLKPVNQSEKKNNWEKQDTSAKQEAKCAW